MARGFWNNVKAFFKHGLNMDVGNGKQLGDVLKSPYAAATQSELTGAAREQNEYTAQREDTQYQRSVADMQAAGLNPALMYQSGASGTSVSPSADNGAADIGQLMQIMTMPLQMAQMRANIDLTRAQEDLTKEKSVNQSKENNVFDERFDIWKIATLAGSERDKSIARLNDEQALRVIQEYNFAQELFSLDKLEKQNFVAKLSKEVDLTEQQINKLKQDFRIGEEQVKYWRAQTGLSEAHLYRIASLLPLELANMDAEVFLKEVQAGKYQQEMQLASAYLAIAQFNAQSGRISASAAAKHADTDARYKYTQTMLDWREQDWQHALDEVGLQHQALGLSLENRRIWVNGITGATAGAAILGRGSKQASDRWRKNKQSDGGFTTSDTR